MLSTQEKTGTRSSASPVFLFFAALFLIVFVLSELTPMVSDDFAYCFSWADWTRITKITQIFPSMSVHRSVTNGRVFVHGIVQLLLLLPRPFFSILNGLNAVLLWRLLRRLMSLSGWKSELPVLLFSVFEVFCFLPSLGENLLWLDGAVNYFWGISCSLLFLYPFLASFLDLPHIENRLVQVLSLALAFIFGTWSENTSLVFLFLAVCLWLMQYRKTHTLRLFPLLCLASALAGYIFLMTAPSTADRAGASTVSVIGYNFRVIFASARADLLWPLMIYAVLLAFSLSFHSDRSLIAVSILFAVGALLALSSYLFAAYFVPRHLCTTVFLLMFGSALLLAGLCKTGRSVFAHVVLAALSVLFCLQFPVGVLDVAVSHHKQQLREEQIRVAQEEGSRTVVLENYFPYTSFGVVFELNPSDSSVGPNVNVADYYGLDAVYGVDPPAEG